MQVQMLPQVLAAASLPYPKARQRTLTLSLALTSLSVGTCEGGPMVKVPMVRSKPSGSGESSVYAAVSVNCWILHVPGFRCKRSEDPLVTPYGLIIVDASPQDL